MFGALQDFKSILPKFRLNFTQILHKSNQIYPIKVFYTIKVPTVQPDKSFYGTAK